MFEARPVCDWCADMRVNMCVDNKQRICVECCPKAYVDCFVFLCVPIYRAVLFGLLCFALLEMFSVCSVRAALSGLFCFVSVV